MYKCKVYFTYMQIILGKCKMLSNEIKKVTGHTTFIGTYSKEK